MMMKMSLWLLLLGFAVTFTAAAGPGSCVGRCGEVFSRGQQCTCDVSCLQHNECCQDFLTICTRDASASGFQQRSFQPLKTTAAGNRKSQKGKKKSSESEEWYTGRGPTPCLGDQCQGGLGPLNPLTGSGPPPPAVLTNPLQHGMRNIPADLLPASIPTSHSGAPDSPAFDSSLPSHSALSQGKAAPVSSSGPGVFNIHLVFSHGGVSPSGTNQGLSGPEGSWPSSSTLQDVDQALGLPVVEGGTEGPGDGLFDNVDLCSDSLINGLAALINGTILIFKGELFWSVDPVSRSVNYPQSITDTLGVPAPIDTMFTRCNCQRNTYIIKGDQYWRLDGNMVMEPGFPKPLASEFPGLTGNITAALAAPATKNKPETIYFFKKGDIMQKFTYPSGSTPTCRGKPRSSPKRHFAPQAEALSAAINLKTFLKRFPTPVTSALSMPSPQRSDRYHHYIFSGPLFFRIQISGDLPMLAKPDPSAVFAPLPIYSPAAAATNAANMAPQNANPPQPANSIKSWLQCL